jgi:hypothetical protein
MKIYPVGADLLRADGKTDRKKLVVVFRNFIKAPKKTTDSWINPLKDETDLSRQVTRVK